jgi:succinyl-diaminopimelate desuccinylase
MNQQQANVLGDFQPLLNIASKLVECKSVTPYHGGSLDFIAEYLKKLDFTTLRVDRGSTANLVAYYGDIKNQPILAFAGHVDVVPPGDISQWLHDPFNLTFVDDKCFGRGICDMKGAIAAFMCAVEAVFKHNANKTAKSNKMLSSHALMFLLTSDEEGSGVDGTPVIVEYLKKNNIRLKYCIVGEPTSNKASGDVIKIGRRGSLTAKVQAFGKQGHVAYPHLCVNPIHEFAPFLSELINTKWDHGNEFFPPTSLQVTNINAGVGVSNVIPGNLLLEFNLRYNNEFEVEDLQKKIIAIFDQCGLHYDIVWKNSAKPFLTKGNDLIRISQEAITDVSGVIAQLKTDGGTSDGRFLIEVSEELIELGLSNQMAHKINESILIKDLHALYLIYHRIIDKFLQMK